MQVDVDIVHNYMLQLLAEVDEVSRIILFGHSFQDDHGNQIPCLKEPLLK